MRALMICLATITVLFSETRKSTAQSKAVVTNKTDYVRPIALSEGFETGGTPTLNGGVVKLKSGLWLFKGAAIDLNPRPQINNKKAVKLIDNGKCSMLFDLTEKGLLSFEITYHIEDTAANSAWGIFVSYNKGVSYKLFGRSNDKQKSGRKAFVLDHSGKVRFEIRKLSGGKNSIWFDDIEIRTS